MHPSFRVRVDRQPLLRKYFSSKDFFLLFLSDNSLSAAVHSSGLPPTATQIYPQANSRCLAPEIGGYTPPPPSPASPIYSKNFKITPLLLNLLLLHFLDTDTVRFSVLLPEVRLRRREKTLLCFQDSNR